MVAIKYLVFILGNLSIYSCLELSKKLEKIESHINCKTDRECKENEFCYNNDANKEGKCKCQEDFLARRNATHYECLPVANNIGVKCVDDVQCHWRLTSASMCDLTNTGTCQCKPNSHFVESKRKCFATAKLGEYCTSHENCKLDKDEFAYCESGRCTCNFHEQPSNDKMRCIRVSLLGDQCTASESCVAMNAGCIEGVCKCRELFVVANDETRCLPVADTLNKHCEQNNQCTTTIPDSGCIDGTCQCLDKKHEIGNRCYTDKNYGERCSTKEECVKTPILENATDCIGGVCSCTIGQAEGPFGCLLESGAREMSSRFTFVSLIAVVVVHLCVLKS